jgi:hypothetical protein
MWKWIVEEHQKDSRADVDALKHKWMKDNGFRNIKADCFFCDYNEHQTKGLTGCECCPGCLVNKQFLCVNETYLYYRRPAKFYAKLVELNEKRKKAKS